MQRSRRGKGNRQEPVLQHQFWPIKSVKRELCKSENTCVHRLVHVTWMAISGDGVLAIICRYPVFTGDTCIKKKVYQKIFHWSFCCFYNSRGRIFQIPWNSQDLCCLQWEGFTWRAPSDCSCSYCTSHNKCRCEHLRHFQLVLASGHLHTCLFSTSLKVEQRLENWMDKIVDLLREFVEGDIERDFESLKEQSMVELNMWNKLMRSWGILGEFS